MSASDPPPIEAEDHGKDPPATPGQRAFATATGAVFQVAGSIFAFGSCCFLSISGLVFSPASSPAEHWFSYLSGDRFETAMATLQIVVSLVGGLGMWSSGLLVLCYGAAIAVRLNHGSPLPGLIAPVVMGVVTTALFLLAGHSRQILQRFPPPENQNVVDDAFLEEYRQRRRHH